MVERRCSPSWLHDDDDDDHSSHIAAVIAIETATGSYDRRRAIRGRRSLDQSNRLGPCVFIYRLLSSTSIAYRHLLVYTARKPILLLASHSHAG